MKTINRNILKLLLLVLLFNLSACDDEFLERQPLDKFTETDVFTTEESLNTFVNGIYNDLYTTGLMDGWWAQTFELFYSPMTDESHGMFDFWHYKEMITGGMSPDNMGVFVNKWEIAYTGIRNANLFFKNIHLAQEAGVDQAFIDQLTDEVRFLRAYLYADIHKHFGGAPIITDVLDLNNVETLPRSSAKELSDFIVSELDEVIGNGNMPASNFVLADSDKGHGTLAAAYALKSRVELFAASALFNTSNDQALWTAAANSSLEAINFAEGQGHALYGDYQRVFLDDYNSEVIFDKSLHTPSGDNDLTHTVDRSLNSNGHGGWTSMSPTQDFVEAYEMADGKDITDATSGYALETFWQNRDPRFYATILYDGADWRGREFETFLPGGLDSRDGPSNWNTSQTGYNWKKFLDETIQDFNGPNRGTQNKIEFRLAELYLNYAETQVALGNDAEAVKYMDRVRARTGVNMPSVAGLTGNALKAKLKNERRIELALEGHRFHDLRRWKEYYSTLNGFEVHGVNIAKAEDGTKSYSTGLVNTYVINPENELIPIPRDEVNKSEGVIDQNPGYN